MIKIAVPSNSPGGLEAEFSGHFGQCDFYTIAMVDEDNIENIEIVPNTGHQAGGCLGPVSQLAGLGVRGIVAGGMGMRPLMGFRQAGIRVFLYRDGSRVKDALSALQAGQVPEFADQHACGGHSHGTCHH